MASVMSITCVRAYPVSRLSMEHYAGIDVSLEDQAYTSWMPPGVCHAEAKIASEPEALRAWLEGLVNPRARERRVRRRGAAIEMASCRHEASRSGRMTFDWGA
jgi:hypothetical protein